MTNLSRRRFLALLAALPLPAAALTGDEGAPLFNPCGALPPALRDHPLTQAAFEGLDWREVWDCHTHLLGLGERGEGAWVTPRMQSFWRLKLYAQYRFFLNAACVDPAGKNVDGDYETRLIALLGDFPAGARAMVMAFDHTHDERGRADKEKSAFHIPNRYAARVAARHPARLMWTASVHPYREDAVAALEEAAANGAVAVKWLPPAMGIDPASPRCDRFYDALARQGLPLITHAGQERAVEGAHQPDFGNVLKLRRPLARGVKVVVAHCASMGDDVDLDRPSGPRVESFRLFERLMAEREFEERLFGDVSAIPQSNRMAYLAPVLAHREWAGRLVNGSDYPLPGVFPLFSVDAFVGRGWLSAEVGEHLKKVREGNPLLFDFLLKRHLKIDGHAFGRETFETARLFRRADKGKTDA